MSRIYNQHSLNNQRQKTSTYSTQSRVISSNQNEDPKEKREILQMKEYNLKEIMKQIEIRNGENIVNIINILNERSMKLLEFFEDILKNINLLGIKTVELEKQNKKLFKQFHSNPNFNLQSDKNDDKTHQEIKNMKIKIENQQEMIDNLKIQIEGQSLLKKNEKENDFKKVEEKIEQMKEEIENNEVKMMQKANELENKRKEVENNFQKQKTKIEQDMRRVNQQIHYNKSLQLNQLTKLLKISNTLLNLIDEKAPIKNHLSCKSGNFFFLQYLIKRITGGSFKKDVRCLTLKY